ncbi:MAG: sugar ABC transporter ATP-binding protein [Eubacteriales bacterium]|nr:sugar ABC transporter ATP-binding protein [Eubacteriales bacterium]
MYSAEDVILEFKNVSKTFPGVKALDGISFSVRRGRVHCLMGENGAGKSTLLKVINGMYKPDEGEIIFDGKKWAPNGSAVAREQGISMIHQELNIIPEMTIAQNMFLGKEVSKKNPLLMDDSMMCREAQKLLEAHGLGQYSAKMKMKELTIGEAQMVEIIKAVSSSSKIILMDEPTSSLSEQEVKILFDHIFKLREQGITIIYISHKMDEIFQVGDDISIFRDGQHIETGEMKNYNRDIIIEKMVGRKMSEVYPPRNPRLGRVALRVENLTRKGYFENISFEVREGEILGMSGLIGAGRTEIARCIVGLDKLDSGDIYIFDKKTEIHSVNAAIDEKIVMVSENRRKYGLILLRSIKENISLAALQHVFKSRFLNKNKEKNMVENLMNQLSIKAPGAETRAGALSGGNQQKVVLAKWLSVSPKILIMDEPTRGIDVGTKYEIYKLMNQMTDEGAAIIMIDSDMEELLGMSDRIAVVRHGMLSGVLAREEFNAEAVMNLAVEGGNT